MTAAKQDFAVGQNSVTWTDVTNFITSVGPQNFIALQVTGSYVTGYISHPIYSVFHWET